MQTFHFTELLLQVKNLLYKISSEALLRLWDTPKTARGCCEAGHAMRHTERMLNPHKLSIRIMDYSGKIKILLYMMWIAANCVVLAAWMYYYRYFPQLMTLDTHILMAWLLATTTIGLGEVSVGLYGFLWEGTKNN